MANVRAKWSLLVFGDELEACLLAITAARQGCKVTLARTATGMLGGLSTRGGLSYMDLTPEWLFPLTRSFLDRAGLKRVALHAPTADTLLTELLKESGVTVLSGVGAWEPLLNSQNELIGLKAQAHGDLSADFIVDATPDASLARACGVPALKGLGGLFGTHDRVQGLGVSPIFRVAGLSRLRLKAAEKRLRQNAQTPQLLAEVFPHLNAEQRQSLIHRPTYAPKSLDYIDILNPTLGAAYHRWRYGNTLSYEQAPFWIDGANIACLPDGTLGFNGLLGYWPNLNEQIALSEEKIPVPTEFTQELQAVERFLQEFTATPQLRVLAPQSLYVRQSITLQAQHNLSGQEILSGGVPEYEAIGTFSYWLDFRGLHPWMAYPELHPLPKPVYRSGLNLCLPKAEHKQWRRLLFLSRSAGYSPLSQGACRIVQHQAMLGEALGVAFGLLAKGYAEHISQLSAQEIRAGLQLWADELGQTLPPLEGVDTLAAQPVLSNSWLLAGDAALVHALQKAEPNTTLEGTVWQAPIRCGYDV
jgi:hypothetical protein